MLVRFLVALSLLAALVTAQTNSSNLPVGSCTSTIPCNNGACCNGQTGFCGYGPKFCTTVAAGGPCTSNCNAQAECGQFAATANLTCPLSVCCSQFGFCGTTEDFCGTGCVSNCGGPPIPSCGADQQSAATRRIGYYEGWATARPCMAYPPEQIDATVLTHINFAFALISPAFQIIPMNPGDPDLWTRTTNLKSTAPALKVYLSIGGWTFNDPPTQKVFSNMVASSASTNTFIASVLSVMEAYAFDGIDIDWEYPGANDRGGVPADTANYVTFMAAVKSAFTPHGYGLTFTAPSSYWYLQHFDLPGLLKSADWVNVMTYDLHGVWDGIDPYIGYVLGAHTNLTEIDAAFQLYWRVGINPSQMVMGMGFYGRSFTLADPSCLGPPCAWVSGGNPGPCSGNAGTLMFSEIQTVLLDPTALTFFEEESAVKWVVWDSNQWVSYDDADTFAIKMNYANDHCLGGTMIWSVDQDDTQYDAMQDLYPNIADIPPAFNESGDQCQATDCGVKACGLGFVSIGTVTTNTGSPSGTCPSNNKALLCCPNANAPTQCTWNGGGTSPCNPSCPPGQAVLALDPTGDGGTCASGLKALCCQTDFESLKNECEFTKCGDTCPSDHSNFVTVGVRGQGSAQAGICDITRFGVVGLCPQQCGGSQVKQFCCSVTIPYQSCKWVGTAPLCLDNACQVGQVQLLTDPVGDGTQPCSGSRTRAYCCDSAGANFVPVPFDDIFDPSEVPEGAETFTVNLDEDLTNGVPQNDLGNAEEEDTPFGEVFIDSPNPASVSALTIQSDWVITGCSKTSDQPQQVLAYCSKSMDDPTSGCSHVFIGQAANTIVKLPSSCSAGPYARIVSLAPHDNQDILSPVHSAQKPTTERVYALHFDFNFAAIPESNGPVYMRADVTDLPDYWDTVVDSPPERKRWLQERGLWKDKKEKRWWGVFTDWLNKLNTVKSKTTFARKFSWSDSYTIFDQSESCEGPPAFESSMSIKVAGSAALNTRYGFYLQGKIVPPAIEAAYIFFNADANAQATFTIEGSATVTYNSDTVQLASFGFPGLYYPGILTIGPSLVLDGYITGQLSIGGAIIATVGYTFPPVDFSLGASSSDQIPANNTPTQFTTGVGQTTINWSVDLNGDLSMHIVPRVQLGVNILGGALVDAEVFIRADLFGGVNIAGSVSNVDAANFCVNPYFGVNLAAGVTGSLLFWEANPTVWPLYSNTQFYPVGGYCFGSFEEQRRSMGQEKRVVLDSGAHPDSTVRIEEIASGKFDDIISPDMPRGAFIHEVHNGQERLIQPVQTQVNVPKSIEPRSKLKRAVPFLPGSLFCPAIDNQISDDGTGNVYDPYADLSGNDLDDAFEKRGYNSSTFHPVEFRKVQVNECANSINPINIAAPAYSGASNLGYFDLANPGATNLDPTYGWSAGAPTAGAGIYGREHVYEIQMLAIFIDYLADSQPNLWLPSPSPNVNFCSWAAQYLTNTPSQYLGNGRSLIASLGRCMPASTSRGTDLPAGSSMFWLEGIANGAKASAIASKTIRAMKQFATYDPHVQVSVARGIGGVISYMNDGRIQAQFMQSHRCVDAVWRTWYAGYAADPTVDAPNRGQVDFSATTTSVYRQWTFDILGNLENNIADVLGDIAGWFGSNTATNVPIDFAGKLRVKIPNPPGLAQVTVTDQSFTNIAAMSAANAITWRGQVLTL